MFLQTSNKKSCNFLIFCPVLTNFLPKCRAQNVDSEIGHIAGGKGLALEKRGIVLRHSKSGQWKHYCTLSLQAEALSMIKPITQRMEEPSPEFIQERDACTKYFDNWSENNQVLFLEFLLSRMCHYQHGQINSFLKPMLQRDFISALPGKIPCKNMKNKWLRNCHNNGDVQHNTDLGSVESEGFLDA